MASYNRIIMIGNLTRDPEYKQLSSGQAVCRLGIASNRQFKSRQSSEMVQEVCFIDVDVWGPQAEVCNQYLQKGRSILVEGRLKFDSWQDQDGSRRSKHSIVADRVTFLQSGQQQGDTFADSQGLGDESTPEFIPGPETKTMMASELPRPKLKSAASPSRVQTSVGEIVFKDQEPFKDDLPF